MFKRTCVIFLSALVVTGCAAPSTVYHSPLAAASPMNPKVLILPPDVVVSLRNAGGSTEPRADWSDQVRGELVGALEEFLYGRGVQFVPYGDDGILDNHLDIIRDANVNMDAVQLSQGGGSIDAERKYALGRANKDMLTDYNADYLLVSVVRANVASAGRQAVAILGAIGGVSFETSSAEFRVGLFDLRDGQLKWANFDPFALPDLGNLTKADAEDWQEAVAHLLVEIPF